LFLTLTIITSDSCNTKNPAKQEFVLHFNSYTFETLDGERKFEGTDLPVIACNSTITFYSDSTIKLHLEVVRTKSTNNSTYKWLSKKENAENDRVWTGYKLDKNESGYYALSIRKNVKNQIIAVSMTDDRRKVVYFDK